MSTVSGRAPIRLRNVGCDPGCFAVLNVLNLVVTPVRNGVDRFNCEVFPSRGGGLRQQAEVRDLAVNLLFGDQVVLGVHRDLRVVAHGDPCRGVHRTRVRIRKGQLRFAALVQRLAVPLQSRLLLPHRRDLRLEMRNGVVCSIAIVLRVGFVHLLEVLFKTPVNALQLSLQRGPREVAVTVVHRLDARAVNGDQLASEQVEFTAQTHKLPKYLPERIPIVAAEIRDRLEVRL